MNFTNTVNGLDNTITEVGEIRSSLYKSKVHNTMTQWALGNYVHEHTSETRLKTSFRFNSQ